MISVKSYSELLEILYSAPLDGTQWERFLTRVCEYTNSKTGAFFCADSGLGLTLRAMGGESPNAQTAVDYNERHAATDPFRAALIRQARVGVFDGEELLPNEGLLQTSMYRELIVQLGLRYATLVPLTLTVRCFEAMSVWRTQDSGAMDGEGTEMLELLLPHIQKALEIHRVLGIAHTGLAGAQAIADASPTASLLVKRDSTVLHSNAAADALIFEESAVRLRGGVLEAVERQSRDTLRSFLLRFNHHPTGHSRHTVQQAISIRRTGERHPLQLIAVSLPQAQQIRTGADILLLITAPESMPAYPDTVLKALYALTPAETEIANGLLMGYTSEEIASLRRVAIGTVRIQMKNLMGKTGSSRQSDLVRLLMSLPQTSLGMRPS
jgi:DNA-binding CsgD family transcriptional regulator